jgi:O-methyltransferase involved in polyketide biosynthesis
MTDTSNTDTKRFDGDSWDLASSVGATAVAARRALASKGPNPLINDPFAEPLVNAVGVDAFIRMMNGEAEIPDDDPAFNPQRLSETMAVRTRFFDSFFLFAAEAGPGERNDVVGYLADGGWQPTVRSTPELYAHNGVEFTDQPSIVAFGDIKYVSATLT